MVLGDLDAIKCTYMVAIDASMQCREQKREGVFTRTRSKPSVRWWRCRGVSSRNDVDQ